MNDIELLCSPVITHIQSRVSGHDDDRLVFADIKLNVSISHFEVSQFLEGSDHLWVTGLDAKTIPRFPALESFKVKGRWENVTLLLAPDLSFFDVKEKAPLAISRMESGRVSRVSFAPFLDTALLTLTYTVQMPGMQIGQMVDRVLGQQVGVHLYSATTRELDV